MYIISFMLIQVEEKINKFLQDDNAKEYKFPPMDQIYRSIMYIKQTIISMLSII